MVEVVRNLNTFYLKYKGIRDIKDSRPYVDPVHELTHRYHYENRLHGLSLQIPFNWHASVEESLQMGIFISFIEDDEINAV